MTGVAMRVLDFLGRHAALRERLSPLRPALVRLALMQCHDRALADDLAQEALAKALAAASQLRDADKLRPWLFGILMNCWRDHLRARRPSEDIDEIEESALQADGGDGPEQAASRRQTVQRVRAAVALLPVGQREVLALVDLESCSYAEVAQILAIPIGTVMSRLSRARAALRVTLTEDALVETPPLRRIK